MEENLDKFNKITINLANIEEKIFDENLTIIILNSLYETFKDVKIAIKYGRKSFLKGCLKGSLL